jgi:hypothetical protein
LLAACTGEEIIPQPTPPKKDKKTVQIRMIIPEAEPAFTRAYSKPQEDAMERIDLLVFRADGTGKEHYTAHIQLPSVEREAINSCIARVELPEYAVRLVAVANVGEMFTDEMNALLESYAALGNVPKRDVLNKFKYYFTRAFDDGRPFPVYGISGLIGGDDDRLQEIKMARAVCRIDIINEKNSSEWEIDSVFIFNASDMGFVAPDFDEEEDTPLVAIAHVPEESRSIKQPLAFDYVSNAGVKNDAMERCIYLPEDGRTGHDATQMVLSIVRNGEKTPRYYRLSMNDSSDGDSPLLRNHRYRIHITAVEGHGYASAEEAVYGDDGEVGTTIEAIERDVEYWVFNNTHCLGVSDECMSFGSSERLSDTLTVYTDYDGWTAMWKEDLAEWVEIGDASTRETRAISFPSTHYYLPVKVHPNETGKVRSGTLRISSGELVMEITIKQSYEL